jgi:large conductance mechanosensitive channel
MVSSSRGGDSPEIESDKAWKGTFMSRDSSDQEGVFESVRGIGSRGFQAGLSTLGDFRKFLLRGNVVDLAVGVVIGAAFNGLVQAVVKDLITPLIGLVGVHDLPGLTLDVNGNKFLFGEVLNLFISFLLTAAVVYFFVIKPMIVLQDTYANMRPKHEEKPKTRECPFCLSTVPLAATRCAYCTAQLPPAEDNTPAGGFAPQR